MDPQGFVAAVNALHAAAAALAALDAADIPAALAADSVMTLSHAATLADNAVAVVTRRVETSGIWAESGARSAASWVSLQTGRAVGQAHVRLQAARIVEEHPDFAIPSPPGSPASITSWRCIARSADRVASSRSAGRDSRRSRRRWPRPRPTPT